MAIEDFIQLLTSEDNSLRNISSARWVEIALHLIDKLQRTLGIPLTNEDPIAEDSGDGFCAVVCSRFESNSSFSLEWRGVVGGTFLGNSSQLHVSASLFPYLYGKRVTALDGASFIELEYTFGSSNLGTWKAIGWMEDTYGEFDYYDAWPSP